MTRMIVSILIGLTLILSTFISTVSIVQKIAYAQVRSGPPSINGIPTSTVIGNTAKPGSNSAVQVVPGGGSSGALSTDGQSITTGPQETVGQGIGTIQQNIQQTVQNIQKIAGASTVVAGVVIILSAFHDLKKLEQLRQQGQHHIIPIPNIPNFHP